MALEDALVLAECLAELAPIPRALGAFEPRRRPRTDWVRAQTHRRDRARKLPPTARNLVLRTAWPRIFRANYAPLLAVPKRAQPLAPGRCSSAFPAAPGFLRHSTTASDDCGRNAPPRRIALEPLPVATPQMAAVLNHPAYDASFVKQRAPCCAAAHARLGRHAGVPPRRTRGIRCIGTTSPRESSRSDELAIASRQREQRNSREQVPSFDDTGTLAAGAPASTEARAPPPWSAEAPPCESDARLESLSDTRSGTKSAFRVNPEPNDREMTGDRSWPTSEVVGRAWRRMPRCRQSSESSPPPSLTCWKPTRKPSTSTTKTHARNATPTFSWRTTSGRPPPSCSDRVRRWPVTGTCRSPGTTRP